jgi:hypothetical protein
VVFKVECFRVTNNSLFPLKAYFSLGSSVTNTEVAGAIGGQLTEQIRKAKEFTAAAVAEAEAAQQEQAEDAEGENKQQITILPHQDYDPLILKELENLPFPTAENFSDYPFMVHPEELSLERDETKDVTIWCFPTTEGEMKDSLVCSVDNNPEALQVPIHVHGAVPRVEVFENENWDFLSKTKEEFEFLLGIFFLQKTLRITFLLEIEKFSEFSHKIMMILILRKSSSSS